MLSEAQIQEAYREALEHGEKLPYDIYKQKLIEYVKNVEEAKPQLDEISGFIKNVDQTRKGAAIPPMPKPGQVMVCQMCGRKMLPKTDAFSQDKKQAMREFKWHICDKCWFQTDDLLDRSTHGLLAERQRAAGNKAAMKVKRR